MRTVILPDETLAKLSVRTGVPGCMLLRANGLSSPNWLLPGREIAVPDAGYCRRSPQGVCPVRALHLPAWPADLPRIPAAPPETAAALARETGLPRRLILLARTQDLRLPPDCRTVAAHYGDTWQSLAARVNADPEELMRLNRCWGALLPGMRVAVPVRHI